MLINEIGVRDESEVAELDRFRPARDPKARESMSSILAGALAADAGAPTPESAPVVELSAPAPRSPAGAADVGHAA
jgi:hypothetical protein